MQKIIIRHKTGSKAGQVEVFQMPVNTIFFGRSAENCQVKYDPERDDLVSRTHLKITFSEDDQFLAIDLNSSNGTFINGNKITGPIVLEAGDTVQLGKDGPQFVFELDPPSIKKTRQGEGFSDSRSTRAGKTDQETRAQFNQVNAKNTSEPVKQGIGHETFERRLNETEITTRRKMINISAGIFTVIALVVGYFGYQSHVGKQELLDTQSQLEMTKADQTRKLAELKANTPMSATEISRLYGPSTVLIETSWKLMHVQSGKQLYHKTECVETNSKNQCTRRYPVYVRTNDGGVEPALDLEPGIPIGESGTGSGFVVHSDGFILTNRHVAASWDTAYTNLPLPGILRCINNTCKPSVLKENDPMVSSLLKWVPSAAAMLGNKPLQGKIAEGRHDYLEVTFPKTSLRFPSRLVRVSDTADVALIKIDVPQALQAAQMDAKSSVLAGDQISVVGYPTISPDTIVKVGSQDPFKRSGEIRTIPEPTITTGNVGKVFSSSANSLSGSVSEYLSLMGDAYQLTVNATGPGNSGGPVFNDKGHVIGIFTSMRQLQGNTITFAIPIKHGLDIMGIQKTIQ